MSGSPAVGPVNYCALLGSVLAIAASLASAAGLAATEPLISTADAKLKTLQTASRPLTKGPVADRRVRIAQKRTYKYEIPKAQRAPSFTPKAPAPAVRRAPTVRRAPATRSAPSVRRGRSIRRAPARRAPQRARRRRASGGSCSGCRNSCYVRYRVQSNSKQFVPCMRRCWNRLCR